MNLSEFGRKLLPIIYENRLFFRPKIFWFTPRKFLTTGLIVFFFFSLTGIFLYNFTYPNTPTVLGVTVTRNSQPNDQEKTFQEISFWKTKIEEFPNYRDAYLKLAILNWKVRLDDQARLYLDQAKKIDPNNETLKELESLLY